ncbi:hypothetical protein BKA93DRAFT_754550 [Sparassis latifolia]
MLAAPVVPSRLAALTRLQCAIFQTSYNPPSVLTGAKYLRASLRTQRGRGSARSSNVQVNYTSAFCYSASAGEMQHCPPPLSPALPPPADAPPPPPPSLPALPARPRPARTPSRPVPLSPPPVAWRASLAEMDCLQHLTILSLLNFSQDGVKGIRVTLRVRGSPRYAFRESGEILGAKVRYLIAGAQDGCDKSMSVEAWPDGEERSGAKEHKYGQKPEGFFDSKHQPEPKKGSLR